MESLPIIIIIGIVVIGAILYSNYRAAKRRQAFEELAQRLGMRFRSRKDRVLPNQFSFLNALKQGHSRYAYNILEGAYKGYPVMVFDYHYTTGSGKNRQDHYFSFFMLQLEKSFPELRIYPENVLSKFGQMLGYDDIDFESVEFSNAFTVRAKDKKFAYDICHTRMMEFLLSHSRLSVEIERDWVGIGTNRQLEATQIPAGLDMIVDFRAQFPEYLMDATH